MEKTTKTVKEKKVKSSQEEKNKKTTIELLHEEESKKDNFKEISEIVEFKGEYIKTIGRRKTAVAQVRMYKDGKGIIMINGKRGNQYFTGEGLNIVSQPLKVTGHVRDLNFSIIVKGGGVTSQIEACRHGIARSLLALDPLLKEVLKANKFLTRDPRKKERKKPGFKGARKRPQWSKR